MYERWMENASCADFPREMFFPTDGGGVVRAQKVCAQCPVARDCLRYALVNHIDHGVWGGCSERKRRRLLHGIGWADVGLADVGLVDAGLADAGLADVIPISAGLRLVPDRDFDADDFDADGFDHDADVEVGTDADIIGLSSVASDCDPNRDDGTGADSDTADAAHHNLADADVLIG